MNKYIKYWKIIYFFIYINKNYKYIKYKYKYINLKQKGGNNQSILILNNFFSESDFNKIINICKKLEVYKDDRVPGRQTGCIQYDKYQELYDLMYKNNKFVSTIKPMMDNINFPPDYPIEYRIYNTGSSGMDWHKDISMFSPDALEIVLTLTNSSDSFFEYIDNNVINKIYPEPNTLMIIQPNTITHQVTPLTKGSRSILKFIVNKSNSIKKMSYWNQINKCPFTL